VAQVHGFVLEVAAQPLVVLRQLLPRRQHIRLKVLPLATSGVERDGSSV